MSDPQPTRNERWTQILMAADTDVIHPRDAIVAAQEHYEVVYGNNFRATVKMLEDLSKAIEETRARAAANAANSTLIREHMERGTQWQDRQEAAVVALRADFLAQLSGVAGALDTLGERLDSIETRTTALEQSIKARDERSNRVHERVNQNSDRIDAIDRFIKQFATLPVEVRDLRTAVEYLGKRLDKSEGDREELHREIAEIKQLVGGD